MENLEFSKKFINTMLDYYVSMKDGEMKPISEISKDIEYSEWQVRKFIDSVDNTKDIEGRFNKLYKLVLLHTIFQKNDIENSHYMNQQEYLKKRAKSREIAKMLYERQQEEHSRKGK